MLSAGSNSLFRKCAVLLCLILGLQAVPHTYLYCADLSTVTNAFSQLARTPALANPSLLVMDQASGEVVYQSNADSPRKPASVIKLLSAAAAYTYLTPNDSYTTSLWQGVDSKTVVIQGSLDPWISYDAKVAQRMKRTSMARFEWNVVNALSLSNGGSLEGTQLLYSNLYPQDVAEIERYFKARKAPVSLKRVSAEGAAQSSTVEIISSTSPRLETIIDWTLTWSDNVLAERIARAASEAAGNTRDDKGVEKTFKGLLENLGISSKNLVVKDGSGLSRENRVSATQISQLLLAIARDPKFAPLVQGLPIGGVSGTLTERFIDTAPSAVGLVKAKTGTLNGTTNLAGYIESAEHQYIFVVIADHHSRSYTVTKKVRAAVDRILGKIAKPLLPELIPPAPSSETVTATNP